MNISLQRLAALTRKETLQILRDRRFLLLVLGMTLVQLFVYSYAASRTVYHLPLAVVDESQDAQSRALVQALVNSGSFDVVLDLGSRDEAAAAIAAGRVKAAVVIPAGLAAGLARGRADVLFLLDGSDSFAVRSGYSAAGLVVQSFGLRLAAQAVSGGLPVTAAVQVLYNPDLKDTWFILPGIIGMILQTLAVEQAALFVVRDHELGTIEQIMATPARQIEIILSKLVPLLALCLGAFGLSVGLAVFWFGVPVQGNPLVYLWLALLFMAACLGLGLFISTRTHSQMEAETTGLVFMLFGMLLSGMFYPRTGMPAIPQFIGDLVPLTYFIRISRGIYTKGVGIGFYWTDVLALVFYTAVVIVITARRFKMRLD